MSNTYPVSLIKDLLGATGKGKIFSKLDLRDTYFCVRIKEGDEDCFQYPAGAVWVPSDDF